MVTYPSDWIVKDPYFTLEDSQRVPVTASERPAGTTPYYGANGVQSFIDGYTHRGEYVLIAEDGANNISDYPVHYVNGKIWVNNHAHAIRGITGVSDTKYLSYAFKVIDYSAILVGGTRAKLNGSALRAITMPLPNLPEQRAIAEVLSGFDEHLANLDELITKKKAIRDGALEGLMSRDLRLDGYNMPWAVRSLNEIAHSRRESSTGDPMDMDVELENLLPCEGQVVGDTSVRTAASFIFRPGDVLFGRLRPYLKKYWLATCSGLRSGEIWALAAKDGVDPRFLFHLVRTQRFLDAAGKTMGTKMPRADWSLLKTESFEVPEVDEQRAIAEVLSGMDDEIRLLAEERAKAERLKLGAMDDLLTGRVRLTLGKEAA